MYGVSYNKGMANGYQEFTLLLGDGAGKEYHESGGKAVYRPAAPFPPDQTAGRGIGGNAFYPRKTAAAAHRRRILLETASGKNHLSAGQNGEPPWLDDQFGVRHDFPRRDRNLLRQHPVRSDRSVSQTVPAYPVSALGRRQRRIAGTPEKQPG